MKTKIDEIVEIEKIDCNEEFFDLHTETENYIAEGIITHNSKPHKKSVSIGEYLPDILKEQIEMVVAVDVSGSIGNTELQDFLSEVIGMARAFQDRIKMTLIQHETEVIDKTIIENGNIEKIKNLKIKGGGGTGFESVVDYINENLRDTKAVVWLTDGYGDAIPKEKVNFDLIWVLSKGGSDELLKDIGKVIKLKD